jgi:stage II sporulation protein M
VSRTRYETVLGGLYYRNEKFLILSALMLISSMYIGYIFAGSLEPFLGGILGALKKRISKGELQLNTLSIFLNNIKVAFLIYSGGLIVGVVTAFYLIFNGVFIGYTASYYVLSDFIIYTLPHGVFELAGIIIAGAAGFKLAYIMLNIIYGVLKIQTNHSISNQFKHLLELNFHDFKDTLILMAIAIVLIIIAAFIEANFTLSLASYIKSVT